MTEEDYDDPAVESLWLQEQRTHVLEYLTSEELSCDGLAESPAWFVAPYVSLWTIVHGHADASRLWIICGDLPTDYFKSSQAIDVRQAMRAFASQWRELATCMMRGERHPTMNIGHSERQPELSGLLQKRSELLHNWAEDDSIWHFAARPIKLPPEPILRAYVDLLSHVFVFLRSKALSKEGIDSRELYDLSDAMHNVPNILLDYGRWTDDAKYREGYLRPFDQKWSKKALALEEFVRERFDMYSELSQPE
jgi:hypothetical protein